MRKSILLLLLFGVILSGCVQNPLKQVPVMKVNITFVEKMGYVVPENYTITQGMVDYAARPKNTIAKSFPAIAGRTMVVKNNTNATMESTSPWEAIEYNGNGTYLFNIGFDEEYYPDPKDYVHISIMVVNKTGKRIGYVVVDKIWE